YTDFINIMTYDLVHGYSKVSGHHTPLYSTPQQIESTDHAVQMLLRAGVPAAQLIIGAAFYGRYFQIDEGKPVDLYEPCHFSHGFSSKFMSDSLSTENGFEKRWDDVAQAPYAINSKRRLLATYDDERSIAIKTKYAVDHRLGGIMFWQLMDDKFHQGLLQVMYENQ
ncbi:MAG TPA: glycosyl hydrolase family 18 protein, partial [Saprospiraceae bacterium]|nr:glycosyl hydrolase family 18 protein [Saprospiraceae bacterium]